MGILKKIPLLRFKRSYQYADGRFIADSSQPNPDEGYSIKTGQYTPHNSTRYIHVNFELSRYAQHKEQNGNINSLEKKLPELYSKREDCCGCTACYSICPAEAIIMRPCEEGFLYPVIDADKCLKCYRCIKVCPIKI